MDTIPHISAYGPATAVAPHAATGTDMRTWVVGADCFDGVWALWVVQGRFSPVATTEED